MKRLHKSLLLSFLCLNFLNVAHSKTPIVAQYYGIWTEKGQTWEQKFRDDTPFTKLNRIYVSFARIIKNSNGEFDIEFDGDANHGQAIIDRMRVVNPAAEIFLSLGGDGKDNAFGGAVNDPDFVNKVLRFLNKYGFTGLDIDWEMYLDKEKLNKLVTDFSSKLHANNMKLTLDVWPFVTGAYDMPVLSQNLDQINIMSYGRNLELSYCAKQYISAGFPADRIIGGVETETHYVSGVDTLGDDGSIHHKALYAKQNLAGMMGWRMDNDYAPIEDDTMPTYKGTMQLWEDMQAES